MAIAAGTPSQAYDTADNSLTWSHTISGSDVVLVVVAFQYGNSIDIPTYVRYNGVDMTRATGGVYNQQRADLYYIVNPAAGAHNVEIYFGGNNKSEIQGVAVTITGANTATPTSGVTNNNYSSGTPNVALSTQAANTLIIDALSSQSSGSSPSAGQTLIYNGQDYYSFSIKPFVSKYLKATAGSISLTYSNPNNWPWAMAALGIREKAVGPAGLKTINNLAKASVKTINNLAIGSVKTKNNLA